MIKPPALKVGDTVAVVSLSWGWRGCPAGALRPRQTATGRNLWPEHHRNAECHPGWRLAASQWRCCRRYTQGILERISGLLFSRPENYSLLDTLKLYDAIRDELILAGRGELPFVANLDFGHSCPMGLLPLGRTMQIDPAARTLDITESTVR